MVPLLIGLYGAKLAFVGMACFAPLAVLAAGRLRRIDDQVSIPVIEIGAAQHRDLRQPARPGSETFAREASYETVHPGTGPWSPGTSAFCLTL